jgi:hypothetical protein
MLAYLFWHRPGAGVDTEEYEESLRSFHAALDTPSASFRLARLPFAESAGYEDWYLVGNWQGLDTLNASAVDDMREQPHDRVASLTNGGWGGIYTLARGAAEIPNGVEWLDKPRGEPTEDFIASLPHRAIWRRQLVLGPAPEFCCAGAASDGRMPI